MWTCLRRVGAPVETRSPASSDAGTTCSHGGASSGAASSPCGSSATGSPTHEGRQALPAELSKAAPPAAERLGQPADPTPRARPPRRGRHRAGGQP
ncbi:unnamed protein product [Prorocentrum cordatum]|uniref:Uncharacterized protein n=1 Tax=Prorocentrum cordatum TaxID=2364126 RepID=A0ABN9QFN3_9DINO|nr:unnamed protein product [Polarella glacialis]